MWASVCLLAAKQAKAIGRQGSPGGPQFQTPVTEGRATTRSSVLAKLLGLLYRSPEDTVNRREASHEIFSCLACVYLDDVRPLWRWESTRACHVSDEKETRGAKPRPTHCRAVVVGIAGSPKIRCRCGSVSGRPSIGHGTRHSAATAY